MTTLRKMLADYELPDAPPLPGIGDVMGRKVEYFYIHIDSGDYPVETWDHEPQPPTRYETMWDADDVEWTRKLSRAEFHDAVVAYRKAHAAWKKRRDEGRPVQETRFTAGPRTYRVCVEFAHFGGVLVGDGKEWRWCEWHTR